MSHREQIEHIKAQLNISTDIELAKILNTSKNNVYSYAIRGIPTKKILQLQRMGITVCGVFTRYCRCIFRILIL